MNSVSWGPRHDDPAAITGTDLLDAYWLNTISAFLIDTVLTDGYGDAGVTPAFTVEAIVGCGLMVAPPVTALRASVIS